jgi:DNA-binding response OmpR family regulator
MRILVVDDDLDLSDFLSHALRSDGWNVDICDCGEQASYLARTNDYDMIVLDFSLPRKNGLIVGRDIRTVGKNTPIIMMSVIDEIDQKVAVLEEVADDYLVKPFILEELRARIQALLRRPQIISGNIRALGDIRLDIQSHKVMRGKREIYLTRKQFSILEYLIRHKDNIVSRSNLIEHAWDFNANPFSNTVEAHISNIRQKLSADGEDEIIHTIPGRGYKISLVK